MQPRARGEGSLLGPMDRNDGNRPRRRQVIAAGRPRWSEQTAPTIYHLFRWARVRRHDGAPVDLLRLSYVRCQPDHAGAVMSRVNFTARPEDSNLG